jgi:hypothetical protein
MGFHVRFKSKEEYLEVLNKLQDNGYLGEEINVGTDMSNSIDIDEAKSLSVTGKRKHIYNPESMAYIGKKLPFINKNEYILMEDPFRESEITALSIDIENRDYSLKTFPELIGKDNVSVGLHTEHDDEQGDLYIKLVEVEDVIDEVIKMVGQEKKL